MAHDFDGQNELRDEGMHVCDCCGAEATNAVIVSQDEPHDDTRYYCDGHYEAYMVGVQHGRYHEAARYGVKPGRDSSQGKPTRKEIKANRQAVLATFTKEALQVALRNK